MVQQPITATDASLRVDQWRLTSAAALIRRLSFPALTGQGLGRFAFPLLLLAACRDEPPLGPSNIPGAESVVRVEVSASRQVLSPGDSLYVTAQAFDAQERVLPAATFTWSSSNQTVATIDASGKVVAVSEGTTTITATSAGRSGTTQLVVSLVQLCECTRIVDSTAVTLIARNDTTGVYVFSVIGGPVPDMESGSIIVGAENGGFLRRVTSSSQSGNSITVQTELAYLEEAVVSGDFLVTTLADAESSIAAGPMATKWGPWTTTYMASGVSLAANGLCCKLDGITIGLKTDDGAKLPVFGPVKPSISGEFAIKDGDIDFLPRLEVSSGVRLGRLDYLRLAVRGGLALNLDAYEIKLSAAASAEGVVTLVKDSTLYIKQKPFATFIGPMPVAGIVTYRLSLKVTPTVSGSAVFGGKFRTGFYLTSGVEWSRTAGWKPVFGTSSYFDPSAPEFQSIEGAASVKIALVPEISVQFYGALGPKAEIEPYAEAAATAALSFKDLKPTGVDWETKISLGLNLNIGAKISILGRVDLAEATFGIPIIKPYKLARGFSDGPLTIYTSVTGEDRPDSLNVKVNPAFVDTLPPFGRDLSTSHLNLGIVANDSALLNDIRSGTSYRHTISVEDLPGNCTLGAPRAEGVSAAQYLQPVDTVAISSGMFIALGGTPTVDTLRVDCIPLGALRIRTVTSGKNPSPRNSFELERLDRPGAGKGTPPLVLSLPGGAGAADTIVDKLAPLNTYNGSTGRYKATIIPSRRNCAVARPSDHTATVLSGDTVFTDFRITCVALGFFRGRARTIDPDAASPSAPVFYRLAVAEGDDPSGVVAAMQAEDTAQILDANGTALIDSLIPLYNASGATGRHVAAIAGLPNRCRAQSDPSRSVTVFPGDTAIATFDVSCVERLHVAVTSVGPGTDSDGYVVSVDDVGGAATSLPLAPIDTIAISGVTPGERTISLSGVDENCELPPPVTRTVSASDSTLVSFVVNCPGPAAPRGLRTTLIGTDRIDLAWNPPLSGSPVAFYRVYRARAGAPGSEVAIDSDAGLDLSDQGLSPYTLYVYQVSSVDAQGITGPRSVPLAARTLDATPPSAPGPLVATAVSGSVVRLVWNSAADPETGISRYRIYRDRVLLDSTAQTTYLSAALSPRTTYSYQVEAVNGQGLTGPLSNLATATTLDVTPPTAPTGLVATVVGATRIDLTWNAASDPETGISLYRVYRNGTFLMATADRSLADSSLSPSTTYTYEVSALNGSGVEGPRSSPASATTLAAPSTTGDLEVVIESFGTGVPTAPYTLLLNSGTATSSHTVAPNATASLTGLLSQTWTLSLQGLPSHCRVVDGPNPRSVIIAAGGVVTTTFTVSCSP